MRVFVLMHVLALVSAFSVVFTVQAVTVAGVAAFRPDIQA